MTGRLLHRQLHVDFGGKAIISHDGEAVSPVEVLPSPDSNPLDTLIQNEAQADLERSPAQFEAFLVNQRQLKTLFRHLCAGIRKPRALARKLRIGVPAVMNLKKRLRRQFDAFWQNRNPGAPRPPMPSSIILRPLSPRSPGGNSKSSSKT